MGLKNERRFEMLWISKKKFDEKIAELEREINRVKEEAKKTAEQAMKEVDREIKKFKLVSEEIKRELEKAAEEKTRNLSARLDEINKKIDKQNTEIEKFISSSQKLTKIVIPRIFNEAVNALVLSQNEVYARMQKIKEMLGEVFGEDFEKQLQDIKKEFEEVIKPKEPGDEQFQAAEEISTGQQVSTDEGKTVAESEQQTTKEKIPDGT